MSMIGCISAGLNFLLVCVGSFVVALAWRVVKAKPAKDMCCGLQIQLPSLGWLNLGVSSQYNLGNAKDHPSCAKSDGHSMK